MNVFTILAPSLFSEVEPSLVAPLAPAIAAILFLSVPYLYEGDQSPLAVVYEHLRRDPGADPVNIAHPNRGNNPMARLRQGDGVEIF
jgi:hypothetical protein